MAKIVIFFFIKKLFVGSKHTLFFGNQIIEVKIHNISENNFNTLTKNNVYYPKKEVFFYK